MSEIITRRWHSPVGELLIGSYEERLCLCDWVSQRRRHAVDRRLTSMLGAEYREGASRVIDAAISQLEEYFGGCRREFTIPLQPVGTEFQQRVWQELVRIPYGTTITYAEEARRIGNERAIRAVAMANAMNAISIMIPCHRVIGSDRGMTGYSGGTTAKRLLLEIEQGQMHGLWDEN